MIVLKNLAVLVMVISYLITTLNLFNLYQVAKGNVTYQEKIIFAVYGYAGLISFKAIFTALASTVIFLSI